MSEERSRRWLFFCLLAVVMWGVWGVISKAAERETSAAALQVISTLGVVPAGLVLLVSRNLKKGRNIAKGCAYAFATGLCGSIGNLAMLKSFGEGADASVVAPLTGMFPLVTVVLAVIILRERLNGVQVFGIVLALGALYLFNVQWGSTTPGASLGQRLLERWMQYAILAMVLWGVAGVLQKLATNEISTELSTVCFALAFVPVAMVVQMMYRVHWDLSVRAWVLTLVYGALIGVGTLILFAAYRDGKASVVTALYAMYPALTVVLAVPIFGEEINWVKGLAIALALAAAVALSYERPAEPAGEGFAVVSAMHVEPLDSRDAP